MKRHTFAAVIFDLDGVITKTARIHALAWKRVFDDYLRLREKQGLGAFSEFTHEEDYLQYVDGKPRNDGTKSFLESRGINLPWGDPTDPPNKETICAIANKKNEAFLELLDEQGVEVYPTTISFIKELQKLGIPSAVISSSKNCRQILRLAGIEDLFSTRVDGEVSEQLNLKGKPEADIFLMAAQKLGVLAADTVVVEDAISGVEAARNGGFGLVIGLARKNNAAALLQNGADLALKDISEINLKQIEEQFQRIPQGLFELWDTRGRDFFLGEKKPVFFLDYDGTLTPIVDQPQDALIADEMRAAVERLSKKFSVAIVSGRIRREVEELVGIKGLIYAGSHGFDISGPGISLIEPRAQEALTLIGQVTRQLPAELRSLEGVLIEEKKFSVAVHYRLADEKSLPFIRECVEKIIRSNNSLRLMSGKKVFELLPAIDWDKGRAVRWIVQALGISWKENSVIYIGDDTTDEDAFRVVRNRGAGILVCEEPRPSAADFRLSSPAEVKILFEKLL